jgi:molybdopterin-synthase adenylyltransferase
MNLGMGKAQAAVERMNLVNPDIQVTAVTEIITAENGASLLQGAQVIVDAVDRIHTRLMLQQLAEDLNVPMVHGAIGGWFGQVMTILPKDRTLDLIYAADTAQGIERNLAIRPLHPRWWERFRSVRCLSC